MTSLQSHVATLTKDERRQHREYETGFNPNCYLDQYTGLGSQFNKFTFTSLHNVFNNGFVKGNSLLEVGCGPTIHGLISASRHSKHIVTSDFLESNRAAVLKWLNNEPGAYDWSPVFKHIAALENEENYHKLEERVRESVEDVIHCDIFQSNPISPVERHFDTIVTAYCLESAVPDFQSYQNAVTNVTNLLNSCGTLVNVGVLNGSFYHVGNKMFSSAFLTKEVIHAALSAVKLNVVYWHEEPLLEKAETHDCTDVFVVVAKK